MRSLSGEVRCSRYGSGGSGGVRWGRDRVSPRVRALHDDPMIAWKIASILLLVAANAFFVAGEFALVSLRRTRIKEMVAAGSRRASSVQKAVSQLNLMLSGTQLGVTLTALGLGAIGEPTL